jgi:phenylalanyl-tRNA synthetase beta chain
MRVPLSWLADFVTWGGSVATLTDRLTMAGLEVAGVEPVGPRDARIRAARILAVEPHPEAERLSVVSLDAGEPVTVVSGAPGLAGGQLVPVALPGARLPSGSVVEAADIRGVRSLGMVCSEVELDLGDDAGRALALDDATPGTPLAELAGFADTVLELEITPNRGDGPTCTPRTRRAQ